MPSSNEGILLFGGARSGSSNNFPRGGGDKPDLKEKSEEHPSRRVQFEDPGMDLHAHASFDDFEMAVVLPKENLDRARVFELNPAGWMFLGFFFQIGFISFSPEKII